MKANAELIKEKVHKIIIGQESTIVLPQRLKLIHDQKLWADLLQADGTPFGSFGAFLLANFPHGVGVEQTKDCMTLEQLRSFCVGYDSLKLAIEEVIGNKPLAKKGEIGRGRIRSDRVTPKPKSRGSNSSAYLLQRLKRDHKDVFARYIAGEFGSVKAAAREAGIVGQPVGHDPLMRMKSYWKKASKKQREEFRNWLRTNEAKS